MSVVVPFDYSNVPSDVVPTLRGTADLIRAMIAKTMQGIIDTGRELAKAKGHIDRGDFASWVEAEVRIPLRTAQAYMSAAKLADDKGATVALLPPGTAYRLAAKSTPSEVVDVVVDRVKAGEVIPDRVVADMISEAKHQRREAAELEKLSPKAKQRKIQEREKTKQRRQEVEEEADRHRHALKQAAAAIIDRFDTGSLGFLLETISSTNDPDGVFNELSRQVAA